jgi:hypothetical protein
MDTNLFNLPPAEENNDSVMDRANQMQQEGFKFSCFGFGCLGTGIIIILVILVIYYLIK